MSFALNLRRLAALAALVLLAAAAPPPYGRLAALNAALLSRDSATATLQAWCQALGAPEGVKIVARRVAGADKPLPDAARAALAPAPGEPVRYRRVQLLCQDAVLSEADNWYLPARLPAEMVRRLDETDTPFGVVTRPLNYRRQRLGIVPLWRQGEPVPPFVLEHQAALMLPDGRPFSFVIESYTPQILQVVPAP
jgi:hypothetical protein